MVVASLVEGRVRVRDAGLMGETLSGRVREELLSTPGVESAECNRRVGSLLVLYNAAVTAVDKILKAVSDLLGSPLDAGESGEAGEDSGCKRFAFPRLRPQSLAEKLPLPLSPRTKKKILNIGMLGTFLLSILAALFDLKKLHILTGIIFTALMGDHIYQRRVQMFV